MKEIFDKIKLFFIKRKLIKEIISYFERYYNLKVNNFKLNINHKIYLESILYNQASKGKTFNSTNDKYSYEVYFNNNLRNDGNSEDLSKRNFKSFLKQISTQDLFLILSHIKNEDNITRSKIKLNKLY